MKILVAQVKPKIGDLQFNFALIKKYYNIALSQNLDAVLLPEMVTTGYPVEDLLLHPAFIQDLQTQLDKLVPLIKATILLLPTAIYQNGLLYNGVIALQNGQQIGYSTKKNLPNYAIFDEKRYFTQGSPEIIVINDVKVGVIICEDFWSADISSELKSRGAEILLVFNASPYEKNKLAARLDQAKARFAETNLTIIYCNQILGQDGIIFDGGSFIYHKEIKHIMSIFAEEACIVDIKIAYSSGAPDINIQTIENQQNNNPLILIEEDVIYGAMVLGLRDYISNNQFKSILLGISGGIDSALVALIAVDAIKAENVQLVMLPSEFTSQDSLQDAEQIAKNLATQYQVIPINNILKSAKNTISNITPLAHQNLQARIRGMILMTLANSSGSLLLTTGNKSENATGYATLYGDMCGGFNPIKDLYKTDLYKIAKFRNKNLPKSIQVNNQATNIIVERIFTKAPSAELSLNQKDSDSLPEYELLDQILQLHIEQNLGRKEIIALGFEIVMVEKILLLVKNSEFKRRQSALGVKLSSCNFEKDRRYPITNNYNDNITN